MKKLLGIAAFILALAPLAQAQDSPAALAGHPDARNDRNVQSEKTMVHHDRAGAKHMRHAKRHHAKHHRAGKHPLVRDLPDGGKAK
jgi:Ni/Co efflux regulator RcnB